MNEKRIAERFYRALTRNVDRWYTDQISYEQFGENQKRLWDAIHRIGVTEAVSSVLRKHDRFYQASKVNRDRFAV